MSLSCLELGLNQGPPKLEQSFLPRSRALRTLFFSSIDDSGLLVTLDPTSDDDHQPCQRLNRRSHDRGFRRMTTASGLCSTCAGATVRDGTISQSATDSRVGAVPRPMISLDSDLREYRTGGSRCPEEEIQNPGWRREPVGRPSAPGMDEWRRVQVPYGAYWRQP